MHLNFCLNQLGPQSRKVKLLDATHNRVLLGHLGANLQLAQLLVVEEHDDCHQRVHTMETHQLCVIVCYDKDNATDLF